jgi:hypothetical protein
MDRSSSLSNVKVFKKFNDAVKYVESVDTDTGNLVKSTEGLYFLGLFMIRGFKVE